MTFKEVAESLPNGFHDAKIVRILLDYPSGALLMTMNILIGTPDSADVEEYCFAELKVRGLYFCFIDPPDPRYPFRPNGRPLSVSGDFATDSSPVIAKLPEGVSYYRFFVDQWNAFIHVAGSGVEISWNEPVHSLDSTERESR
jgi:hypothetical protein